MARRKSPTLTEVELELMDVLWTKGNATVGEIVEALPEERLRSPEQQRLKLPAPAEVEVHDLEVLPQPLHERGVV